MIDRVLTALRVDEDETGEPVPVRIERRNGEVLLSLYDMELALDSAELDQALVDLDIGSRLAEAA